MKKYIVPAIVLTLVAILIFVRYAITAPARAAARDLEAINGIAVGKMTEAELLGRSAFQKVDRHCAEADCIYHTERTNDFLKLLHLAPSIFFGTAVWVRNGMVVTGRRVCKQGRIDANPFEPKKCSAGRVCFQSVREAFCAAK